MTATHITYSYDTKCFECPACDQTYANCKGVRAHAYCHHRSLGLSFALSKKRPREEEEGGAAVCRLLRQKIRELEFVVIGVERTAELEKLRLEDEMLDLKHAQELESHRLEVRYAKLIEWIENRDNKVRRKPDPRSAAFRLATKGTPYADTLAAACSGCGAYNACLPSAGIFVPHGVGGGAARASKPRVYCKPCTPSSKERHSSGVWLSGEWRDVIGVDDVDEKEWAEILDQDERLKAWVGSCGLQFVGECQLCADVLVFNDNRFVPWKDRYVMCQICHRSKQQAKKPPAASLTTPQGATALAEWMQGKEPRMPKGLLTREQCLAPGWGPRVPFFVEEGFRVEGK